MKLKGMDRFHGHLPDYPGKKIRFFARLAAISVILSLFFLVVMDGIFRLLLSGDLLVILSPFGPILGVGIVEFTGFLLVYLFWKKKDKLLQNLSNKAYQKALKYALIGIPCVIIAMFHTYFPTDLFIPISSVDYVTGFLSRSITEILIGFNIFDVTIRSIIGLLLLIVGITTAFRTLMVFGMDYMGLVYVYYPEESEIQHHEIYSILRHPTYFALLTLALGGVIVQFSLYSIIIYLMLICGMFIHIHYVEEKELIKRFGDSYKEYRKNVHAI
ncbi:MAG: methyltransferase family protein, partial [Promethearchaeota archaeon]